MPAGGSAGAQAGGEGGEQQYFAMFCNIEGRTTVKIEEIGKVEETKNLQLQVCVEIPRQAARQVPKQVKPFHHHVSCCRCGDLLIS